MRHEIRIGKPEQARASGIVPWVCSIKEREEGARVDEDAGYQRVSPAISS